MTLEGVLGPNGRLDAAAGMSVEAPDAACVAADGRLLFSSADKVMALDAWNGVPERWADLGAPVTALCSSPGGTVAVGLSGGGLDVRDEAGGRVDGWPLPSGSLTSVVDCAFRGDDELVLVDCGYGGADLLAQAAWDEQPRGRVVSLNRSGEMRVVIDGLHCPMGVCLDAADGIHVSLFERAVVVDRTGTVVQGRFPGYLGRLRRTTSGYLLACWSRRDPLIEFLKTEHDFVAEMKARIEPRHWIGPRIQPEFSHDFPIELGATRLFGEVKPWAPSFSYGLAIETDTNLMPLGSWQSRADGERHGICDALVWNGDLIAVSRGSGEILNLGARA